jgi:CheY-like chemotaxis protein
VGDLEVVGESADDSETLRVAEELRPDIVLLDISMPGAGGIEVTRRLRDHLPATRVLILTVHEDGTLLREAIPASAPPRPTPKRLPAGCGDPSARAAAWRRQAPAHDYTNRQAALIGYRRTVEAIAQVHEQARPPQPGRARSLAAANKLLD